MELREKLCRTCPFKPGYATQAHILQMAAVPPASWPCHLDRDRECQCRGHFEAQRKYPDAPVTEDVIEIARLNDEYTSHWFPWEN